MRSHGQRRGAQLANSRRECGAIAVEFALVLPLLVMLLLGITTAGLSYSHAIGVTNAVREGARFGATAEAGGDAADAAVWAGDVIARVRATQFDDPSSQTQVCVQLWKKDTGVVSGSKKCEGPSLGVIAPDDANDHPGVPASLPSGACVVRVIAARPFTINIGITLWENINADYAVARYERGSQDCEI